MKNIFLTSLSIYIFAFLTVNPLHADQQDTTSTPSEMNVPLPKGPFTPVKVSVENIQIADSHDLYRKWTMDRILKEDRGVGATFTVFEFYLESPAMSSSKYYTKKINIRLEPNQTKKLHGFVWVDGGTNHTEDDLHFKNRGAYYGVDDKGHPVKAEYTVGQ